MPDMKHGKLFFILVTFTCSLGLPAQASGTSRENHRYGGYFSVLGDPYLTLLGINLAANLLPYMRVNVGYGSWTPTFTYTDGTSESVNITTIGGGVKFMHPDWDFTPVIGVNYAHMAFNRANKTVSTS